MHTVGIDLVEVEVFERAISKTATLYDRLFAIEEIKDHKRVGVENLAAWFAAKEAVMKAIWAHTQVIIEWHDIMIFHGEHGQPFVKLSKKLKDRLSKVVIKNISISLTHITSAAAAIALVEFE